MCNHYRGPMRKAGLEFEIYGFEEFSETPRDIYPDRLAPVIRLEGGQMRVTDMRWGFPPLPQPGARPLTNTRNLNSSYWRPWLKPEARCLVPFSAFAEPLGPGRGDAWFARADGLTACFAGIWRSWTGTRGTKAAPVTGEHLLFSILTCEPNGVVEPRHSKAMPVVFTTNDEMEAWMSVPADMVPALQRPLADDLLVVL